MKIKNYEKPNLLSYPSGEILEILGVGHSGSSQVSVEIWRGAKLDAERSAEFKMAKLPDTDKIIQIKENVC